MDTTSVVWLLSPLPRPQNRTAQGSSCHIPRCAPLRPHRHTPAQKYDPEPPLVCRCCESLWSSHAPQKRAWSILAISSLCLFLSIASASISAFRAAAFSIVFAFRSSISSIAWWVCNSLRPTLVGLKKFFIEGRFTGILGIFTQNCDVLRLHNDNSKIIKAPISAHPSKLKIMKSPIIKSPDTTLLCVLQCDDNTCIDYWKQHRQTQHKLTSFLILSGCQRESPLHLREQNRVGHCSAAGIGRSDALRA